MKPTTLMSLGLAHLASLANPHPLLAHEITSLDSHASLPESVIFHHTNGHSNDNNSSSGGGGGGGGGIGSPAFADLIENVTACHQVAYDDPSPARTRIVRDDCLDLARRVQRDPGFYELTGWAASNTTTTANDHEDVGGQGEGGGGGRYRALVRSGTCEFGVQRLDGGLANASASSDVAIIGNQDIFRILNASVFDFAGEDEYYMDAMRINGHMSCSFWFSINASMEFLIQYADSGAH